MVRGGGTDHDKTEAGHHGGGHGQPLWAASSRSRPWTTPGHVIVDFSIYDALRAGFGGVVFIVKPEMEADFRATIGARVGEHVPVRIRAPDARRPAGGLLPCPRAAQKPWGTGHAVLCARECIDGPFAVINADDFYGRTAFQAIYGFLTAPGDAREHAMVGYRLRNTLTENGSVSRGVCRVDADGYLSEHHRAHAHREAREWRGLHRGRRRDTGSRLPATKRSR